MRDDVVKSHHGKSFRFSGRKRPPRSRKESIFALAKKEMPRRNVEKYTVNLVVLCVLSYQTVLILGFSAWPTTDSAGNYISARNLGGSGGSAA
jgi:hypothetical protein